MSGANDPTDALEKDSPPPIDTVSPFLPGLDNVFVVLRTNATEAPSKLPVHFATTLHCTPHYATYSDLAEEIAGHPIHDAPYEISPRRQRSRQTCFPPAPRQKRSARALILPVRIPDTSTPPPGAASPPSSPTPTPPRPSTSAPPPTPLGSATIALSNPAVRWGRRALGGGTACWAWCWLRGAWPLLGGGAGPRR